MGFFIAIVFFLLAGVPVSAESRREWPIPLNEILGELRMRPPQLRCHLRELTQREFAELAAGGNLEEARNHKGSCPESRKVLLYTVDRPWNRPSLRLVARAKGGRIFAETQILPKLVLQPPLCAHCDAIWLGRIYKEDLGFSHYFQVANQRAVARVDFMPPVLPRSDLDKTLAGGRVQGRVLLVDDRPTSFLVNDLAGRLKKAGASEVVWLWSGLEASSPFPVPVPPTGVVRAGQTEVDRLLKSGALIVDARRPRSWNDRLVPWAVSHLHLKMPAPLDQQGREVLVYGRDVYSQETTLVLKSLKDQGYGPLFYDEGGMRSRTPAEF